MIDDRAAAPANSGAQIPRRILQTAKTPPQSVRLRAFAAGLRLLHPDYEFQFFGNAAVEQFMDREFPRYRTVFDGFRYPIQRYDFFRYLAVYRYGGFYFDLDVAFAAPLDSLLASGCVFPFEQISLNPFLRVRGMDWEAGNYAFGAAAGHPFLEALIENCVRGQREPAWVEKMLRGLPPLSRPEYFVLCSTGPGMVSRTLLEHPELAAGVNILFPEDVCDGASWNSFGTYGVHLMDGGWRPGKGAIRKRIERVWIDWQHNCALRASQKLGPKRNLPCMGGPGR